MSKLNLGSLFSLTKKTKVDPYKKMRSVVNINKENDDESIREINEAVDYLIEQVPSTENFLGKEKTYPTQAKRHFLIRMLSFNYLKYKKLPDLTEIRNHIGKPPADVKPIDISNIRAKLKKLLKKFDVPKVHALNAALVFNDVAHSGLVDDRKFLALKESLIELSKVLYSGDKSLFHVTLYIKTYVKYLETLSEKMNKKYNEIKSHSNKSVQISVNRLRRRYLQVTAMMQITGKIKNIADLSTRLKGTSFITEEITLDELQTAMKAEIKDDKTTKLRGGKIGAEIMLIELTINLLLSNIPYLKEMVKKNLKNIPDNTRDFILQKSMVRVSTELLDFQMALFGGDREEAKRWANKIFDNAIDTINEHLEYAFLSKPYEADPYLKAAWIAKESKGLIVDSELEEKLKTATKLLGIIEGDRCLVKGAAERAMELHHIIRDIKLEKNFDL